MWQSKGGAVEGSKVQQKVEVLQKHQDDDFLFKSSHTHAFPLVSLRKFLNKSLSYCSQKKDNVKPDKTFET